MENTLHWITSKFGKNPELAKANEISLRTGYNFADTTKSLPLTTRSRRRKLRPASTVKLRVTKRRRSVCGCFALAGRPLFYGSYPITPASDILHELARHKSFGVKTFQAEDEIAAVCAAIAPALPVRLA